jgi:hypothetical protein
MVPYFDRRNPLYAVEVDPVTFTYSERQVVTDARREGLPFELPCLHMSKLCPNQGNRQLMIFRAIDRFITSSEDFQGSSEARSDIISAAGIHCAEIIYRGDTPDPWEFGD